MALGPFIVVDAAVEAILDGTIVLPADDFQAVLITAAHTANPATDDTWADISASEATGSGYTTEGVAIGPLVLSRTADVVTVDSATNPTWNPATVSAKYLYVVKKAGGALASGDLILGYIDLNDGGGNMSAVAAEFSVTWPATGLFRLRRPA